ncbi:MAG TPA: hypothetical protein VHB68_13850 [Steroidobacteraceae bacterium]|nr:hypothetical protein [Steroidobacteraceae bacterium]
MTVFGARLGSGARNGLRILTCLLVLSCALLTGSCGNNYYDVGTPVITLTDRSGDFTSYIVTIDYIYMTRKDGTVVTLPATNLRVDMVELANLIEVLEAPAAGVGTYVSATFVIDYSAPQILVNINGRSVATTLIDPSTSAAPTTQTLVVQFDPTNPLVITQNTSHLAAFDFDLEAGSAIDYSTSPYPTVYVSSYVTVNASPVYNKPVRARGLFVQANTKNDTFIMNVRPLHYIYNTGFGAMTVVTNGSTYYNINGVAYTGAAGLAALSQVENTYADLQVEVYGTGPGVGNPWNDLTTITPSFVATQVYAGTSLESTVQDHIIGTVKAISNNTLTVGGAELVIRANSSTFPGAITFADTATVTVSDATAVSQDGVIPGTQLTTASISVGQAIDVSGQATTDSYGNPLSLDATAGPSAANANGGQVRLQSTPIWGTVNSLSGSNLDLNLLLMNNFEPGIFTFTGTGSGTPATPPSYAVDTGSLDTSAITASTIANPLVKVDGIVAPFGSGPPYFNATNVTLEEGSTAESTLVIEWTDHGTTSPFTTILSTGLVVDLNNSLLTAFHEIRTGPNTLDIKTLPSFTITPTTIGANTLLLSIGNITNEILSFNTAQIWADHVVQQLTQPVAFEKLVATGYFDSTTNTFYAYNISVYE